MSSLKSSNLLEFIERQDSSSKGIQHIVLGNKAGDADSIVSALALAYVESSLAGNMYTPLISITKEDFNTQRPETTLLLKLAGIPPTLCTSKLLFRNKNQRLPSTRTNPLNVTLVDHNRLDYPSDDDDDDSLSTEHTNHWVVREIRDHHMDEGHHTDTCTLRQVAFQDGHATVASTCTLVVERMQQIITENNSNTRYPADVSLLLLGVILLDSVNLQPKAGKVTPRDMAAVQALLDGAAWTDLSPTTRQQLCVKNKKEETNNCTTAIRPNTTALFEALQGAKFDQGFWRALSVRNALRLDYKQFSTLQYKTFGISTVLLSLQDFLSKADLMKDVHDFMQQRNVDFFAVMLTFTEDDDDSLRRQLILCSRSDELRNKVIEYLSSKNKVLELCNMNDHPDLEHDSSLKLVSFDQRNAKASRKQVAPILLEFFEQGA